MRAGPVRPLRRLVPVGSVGSVLPLVLLATVLSVAPAPAHASARRVDEARALLERAREHYAEGDYEAAAGLFLAAWERHPVSAILFNVAQSFRMSGRQEEARDWYERYLSEVPDAPNRREVELRIDQLTRSIERHRSLAPRSDVAAAQDRAGAVRIVETAEIEESPPAGDVAQTADASAASGGVPVPRADGPAPKSDDTWWETGLPPDAATAETSPWREPLPWVLAGSAAALVVGSLTSYAIAHASWGDAGAVERSRPEVDRRIRAGDTAHAVSLGLGGAAVLVGAGAGLTFVF